MSTEDIFFVSRSWQGKKGESPLLISRLFLRVHFGGRVSSSGCLCNLKSLLPYLLLPRRRQCLAELIRTPYACVGLKFLWRSLGQIKSGRLMVVIRTVRHIASLKGRDGNSGGTMATTAYRVALARVGFFSCSFHAKLPSISRLASCLRYFDPFISTGTSLSLQRFFLHHAALIPEKQRRDADRAFERRAHWGATQASIQPRGFLRSSRDY